jgi:hypothetical protein
VARGQRAAGLESRHAWHWTSGANCKGYDCIRGTWCSSGGGGGPGRWQRTVAAASGKQRSIQKSASVGLQLFEKDDFGKAGVAWGGACARAREGSGGREGEGGTCLGEVLLSRGGAIKSIDDAADRVPVAAVAAATVVVTCCGIACCCYATRFAAQDSKYSDAFDAGDLPALRPSSSRSAKQCSSHCS